MHYPPADIKAILAFFTTIGTIEFLKLIVQLGVGACPMHYVSGCLSGSLLFNTEVFFTTNSKKILNIQFSMINFQ
jgi:hypothetical protein